MQAAEREALEKQLRYMHLVWGIHTSNEYLLFVLSWGAALYRSPQQLRESLLLAEIL